MTIDDVTYPKKFSIERAMVRGETVWNGRLPIDTETPWKNGLYRQIAFLAMDYVLQKFDAHGYDALSHDEKHIYNLFQSSENQENRPGVVREYCEKHAERIRANVGHYVRKEADAFSKGRRLRTDEYWIMYLTQQTRRNVRTR